PSPSQPAARGPPRRFNVAHELSTRRRSLTVEVAFATLMAILFAFVPVTRAHAAAALSITDYRISSNLPPTGVPANGPSTLQAGSNPDAGSYTTFAYSNGTEDLKTALTNFAPGLLGNPEAVPKCSEVAL